MRRRSNTIQAKNVDDYLTVAQKKPSYVPYKDPTKRNKAALRPSSVPDLDLLLEENGSPEHNKKPNRSREQPSGKENKDPEDHWHSFDFDCEENWEHNEPKDDEKIRQTLSALSENTADTDVSEDTEANGKGSKVSIVKRVMVIGCLNSGKHSLINAIFDCNEDIKGRKGRYMDLMMKTEECEDERAEVRYQFWMENLEEEEEKGEKFRDLVKTYYKNTSLFMFVYAINNRKSFEFLENVMASVLGEAGNGRRIATVVLGNKSDLESEREVKVEKGLELKKRFNIEVFKETNHRDVELKEMMVRLLCEGDERMMMSKRAVSLLSVE